MEEDINTLRKKTEDFYKHSKFDEIISLLTDEELERRKDADLYAWRARANLQSEKYVAETMVYAEKSIASDPFNFIAYYARALVWADRKEYKKAIKDYTKAIELNLDFAYAYYYRGIVWQNLNKNKEAFVDFDIAIEKFNEVIKIDPDYADAYYYRATILYNKKEYDKAIADYTKVIDINSDYELAFHSRGLTYFAKKEYDKAIEDYTTIIKFESENTDIYYNDRGNAWFAQKEYRKAISDYSDAIKINPTFENAYYNRGLARKENNYDKPEKIKQDFEKYLDLTSESNDIGVRYAKYYIKKIDEKRDLKLTKIIILIDEIKKLLLIEEQPIAHYTSLSAMKKLILADNNKLWISEGNFMNDPSEGTELFRFLYSVNKSTELETTEIERFVPKPFIGSFVTEDMHNDLNMWRFYGKENGVEAKGCAIVLKTKEFIEDIKNSLSNENNKEARTDDESDVNFYRVVYLKHDSEDPYIPDLDKDKGDKFNNKIKDLKDKVEAYRKGRRANINSLKEHLNDIAFLFKRDEYKNEKEVRLVMKGVEFEKKFCEKNSENRSVNPPLVYIELEPIKNRVKRITLGPKVDKANEWASALRYSYKGEDNVPEIIISHLPYK